MVKPSASSVRISLSGATSCKGAKCFFARCGLAGRAFWPFRCPFSRHRRLFDWRWTEGAQEVFNSLFVIRVR
jgi:hypothetical protein